MKIVITFVALAICGALALPSQPQGDAPSQEVESFSRGNRQFSADLYKVNFFILMI